MLHTLSLVTYFIQSQAHAQSHNIISHLRTYSQSCNIIGHLPTHFSSHNTIGQCLLYNMSHSAVSLVLYAFDKGLWGRNVLLSLLLILLHICSRSVHPICIGNTASRTPQKSPSQSGLLFAFARFCHSLQWLCDYDVKIVTLTHNLYICHTPGLAQACPNNAKHLPSLFLLFWRKCSDASVSTKALLRSAMLATESWATEVRSVQLCDSASG